VRDLTLSRLRDGDDLLKEWSFNRETKSRLEGERERALCLRMSFTKFTELSRSRAEGGTSSAGSSSGIWFPLSSLDTHEPVIKGKELRILATIYETHGDVEFSHVQFAAVIDIRKSPKLQISAENR